MSINQSDNIQLNSPKELDNRNGRFDGTPAKWRPYHDLTEFLTAQNPESRYETQSFWVRSQSNSNKAVLYILDKTLTPYPLLDDVDLSNYYTKNQIDTVNQVFQDSLNNKVDAENIKTTTKITAADLNTARTTYTNIDYKGETLLLLDYTSGNIEGRELVFDTAGVANLGFTAPTNFKGQINGSLGDLAKYLKKDNPINQRLLVDDSRFAVIDNRGNLLFQFDLDGLHTQSIIGYNNGGGFFLADEQQNIAFVINRKGEAFFKEAVSSFVNNYNQARQTLEVIQTFYGVKNPPEMGDLVTLVKNGMKKGDIYVCTSDGQVSGTELQRSVFNGSKLSTWKVPQPYASYQAVRSTVDIVVDCGYNHIEIIGSKNVQRTVESMVGFLHITDIDQIEGDAVLLKTKYMRVGLTIKNNSQFRIEVVNAMLANKITPIIILSDFYGAPHPGWESPLVNQSVFLGWIDTIWNEFGTSVIYDIWNEPDLQAYWTPSREDFFATVKLAHDHIRAKTNGGHAIITAPSTSTININFYQAFLKYCSENNVVIQYFNTHYLTGGPIETSLMNDTLENIKEIVAKYPKVAVEKVFIPELISSSEMYIPAETIVQFKKMEESGMEGTCRACWTETQGGQTFSNCTNNTLNGLLTPDKKKRATYWAHRYYAESLSKRLPSISHNECVVAIPYFNANENEINIILASSFVGTVADIDISITCLSEPFFDTVVAILETRLIPFIGDGAVEVASINVIKSEEYTVQHSMLRIRVPALPGRSVYLLTIREKL